MTATKLTTAQNRIITKELEFSYHRNMAALIKAFPSCTFKCTCQSNGDVTTDYKVTGPLIWVNKIERKYTY